ncbi:hypothetical protein EDB89DRAFT_2242872 [Lactarius sanguifluus]|nr:hypothetical protein EDB89DRAFT_2242872 [Lactarius sanguifluus]
MQASCGALYPTAFASSAIAFVSRRKAVRTAHIIHYGTAIPLKTLHNNRKSIFWNAGARIRVPPSSPDRLLPNLTLTRSLVLRVAQPTNSAAEHPVSPTRSNRSCTWSQGDHVVQRDDDKGTRGTPPPPPCRQSTATARGVQVSAVWKVIRGVAIVHRLDKDIPLLCDIEPGWCGLASRRGGCASGSEIQKFRAQAERTLRGQAKNHYSTIRNGRGVNWKALNIRQGKAVVQLRLRMDKRTHGWCGICGSEEAWSGGKLVKDIHNMHLQNVVIQLRKVDSPSTVSESGVGLGVRGTSAARCTTLRSGSAGARLRDRPLPAACQLRLHHGGEYGCVLRQGLGTGQRTSDCAVPTFQRVSNYTTESKIPRHASEKRQLEVLDIAEGASCTHHSRGFCLSHLTQSSSAPICNNAKCETWPTITEMDARSFSSTAAGKRGVISDTELDILLDRCKEVFEGRGVGWKGGTAAAKGRRADKGDDDGAETHRQCRTDGDGGLFEVYEALADEGNDTLEHMFGEGAPASPEVEQDSAIGSAIARIALAVHARFFPSK